MKVAGLTLRGATLCMALLLACIALSACSGEGEGQNADATGSAEAPIGSTGAKESADATGSAEAPSGSASQDKDALIALLDALDARPRWADDIQTLNDVPPQERTGIITDESGRVVGLLLGSSFLSGELPAEVGDLPALRWLELSGNQISGALPPQLGNLSNLEGLILSDNLLTGPLPPEMGNLSALEVMNLSQNQLAGEVPPELGNLGNLRRLYLEFNQLTGEMPPELGKLSALRELDLGNNQLIGAVPAEMGHLAALRWLDLTGNRLSGGLPEDLRARSDQGVLHIADIYFAVDTGVPYSAVAELESDSAELSALLSQATECRAWLWFPKDSFCIGGGRYILGHDPDGYMVIRDLHWQEDDQPESIGETLPVEAFKMLGEGTIPGFVAAPILSAGFSSPHGDFYFGGQGDAISEKNSMQGAVQTISVAHHEMLGAIQAGDAGRIEQLVASGTKVPAIVNYGQSVLLNAVSENNAEMVRVLIDAGADVDFQTPLMTAIDRGNAEIVRILVDAGADVNAKSPWNDHPWSGTLLDEAQFYGDSEIIDILSAAGGKSQWPDGEAPRMVADATPFYTIDAAGLRDAILDGDADSVRMLVEAGVNVSAKGAGGESILFAAVFYQDDPEIVQILVDAGADLDAKNDFGQPILFEAVSPFDWGPDAREILQILVDAGADVNAKDDRGRPVLAEAIRWSDPSMDLSEVVRVLVDAGADVNIDENGVPVIFVAVRNGRTEVVRILVQAGADVNSNDSYGNSILQEAMSREKPEITQILIDAGAVK